MRASLLALAAALVGGCAPPPPPPAAPPLVSVNPRAWLGAHPAARDLAALDRQIRALSADGRPSPAPLASLSPPLAPRFPEPVSPIAAEPNREIDRGRAAEIVSQEFAIRAAADPAAPEPATSAATPPPGSPLPPPGPVPAGPVDPPDAPEPSESAEYSTGLGPRMTRLRRQLLHLEEKPGDRLRYTPEQLARRRALYRAALGELDELYRRHVDLLRGALQFSPPAAAVDAPAAPGPPTSQAVIDQPGRVHRPRPVAPVEGPRLRVEKEAELARIRNRPPLPAPVEAEIPAPSWEALPGLRPVALSVREAKSRALPAAGARDRETLRQLRRRRAELEKAMLADLGAAAQAVARRRGVRVSFEPGASPDRTQEFRAAVLALMDGEGR